MSSTTPDLPSRPAGAVFLSYAREDTEPARRIADALRAFGVEVWFDQSELRGGDAWDQKIRSQIKTCTLFLPVISQRTEDRSEGYFRREWKLAIDRTHDMAAGRAFIVPVVIDGTNESRAAVPEEFMRYQWTRLAQGVPTPEFVTQVRRLLETPRKSATSDAPSSDERERRPDDRAPARKNLPTRWVAGTVIVVALAGGAYLALRPRAPAPAASAPSSAVRPSSSDDKSVAVLAFADLSEARNSEYFSDGVSEELLNVLAKVPGLRVAARTSAFFFKGKNLPIPEIGQKLNVAYVVEGSVQRAGDRVKITAQLIKVADGFHVWSDTFTRDLKDVFAVQEEIARLIAQTLQLKLGVASAAATSAVNPQAFELYLQGRQAWNLRTTEGFARAEELFNRALALEPNFARALTALADVWLIRSSSSEEISRFGQRDSPAIKRIFDQIGRALALDPDSAEVHASLGNAHWMNWQLAEAARELRRAIALNPNYATAHQWLGRVLLSDGYYEEALASLQRAAQLDPLSPRILDNFAIGLRTLGRPQEALVMDERALAIQPGSVQAAVWRTLELSTLGRHDEALAQARQLPPESNIYYGFLVSVYIRAGARADAEALLKQVPASAPTGVASGLAALGRSKEALAALDAATANIQEFSTLFSNPDFDSVRNEPAFLHLIATVGMTEAYARARAWHAKNPPRPVAAAKK